MQKLFTLIVIAALLAGCSDGPAPTANNQNQNEFPDEVRQMLVDNAATMEQLVDLPTAAEGHEGVLLDPAAWNQYDVYSVTYLWGNPGVTTNEVVDWSGQVAVEGVEGQIRTVALIDFETPPDTVFPTNAVHWVPWESYTSGDFDGLSFLVFISKLSYASAGPLALLNFTTEPFELSLTPKQLEHYSNYFVVDNNKVVAVLSKRIWQNSCRGGTLSGTWHKYEPFADTGWFDGMWRDEAGEPIGIFTARYWTNNDGSRHFKGSISGVLTDVVLGEMSGVWSYADPRLCPMCGAGKGWFRGKYRMYEMGNRAEETGYFFGEFGDFTLPWDVLELPLRGVWRTACPDQSPSVVSNAQ